jgi:hypothetical protein
MACQTTSWPQAGHRASRPRCPVLDTYAGVLQELGKCREALPVQQRAVDLLPDSADPAGRRPYEDRLSVLEASCGKPGAAGAPSP